jgi:hypothetical protein
MIFNGLSSLFSLRPLFLMREFILRGKMSGRRKDGRDCPRVGAEGEGGGKDWELFPAQYQYPTSHTSFFEKVINELA